MITAPALHAVQIAQIAERHPRLLQRLLILSIVAAATVLLIGVALLCRWQKKRARQ